MKRTIVTVLIMCMFLSCMCFSYAEEKGTANKLEGFDEALKDYNPDYLDLNNQGMIKVWNKEVKVSDDFSMEINGILADKYKTVIFYTIKSTEEKLYDSQHLKLSCESLLPFGSGGYTGARKVYKGKREIKFINSYSAKLNPIKDNVDFRIDINYGDDEPITISLPFAEDDFVADYFEKELDINIQKKSVDYKISKVYGSPMQTLLFMESSEVVDDDDEEVVELKKSSLLYNNNKLKNFGGGGIRIDKDTFLDHCSFSPVNAKADSLVWKYDDKDFRINLKGSNPSYGGDKDLSQNGKYAVVLSTYKGIKLWTGSGSTAKYNVHKYENDLNENAIDKGDIIEYAIENNGSLTVKDKVYDARRNKAIGENAKLVKLDSISSNKVKDEESDSYSNSKDSQYINYSEYKENNNNYKNNLEALKWEDIKKLDIPNSDSSDAITALIVTESRDEIALLTFIDNYGKKTESDSHLGYLISYETHNGVMTVKVDVFDEGIKEYKITDDDDQEQIKEREIEELIVFVLKDGELKLKELDYDDHEFYGDADGGKMWFKDKDGQEVIVYVGDKNTTKTYKYNSKVIVYYYDDEKNINNIDAGDALEFIMKDDEILAIKYTEEEKLAKDKRLKEDSSSENFGVIIKKDKGMDDCLKLWTKTGDTIKYDIDDYESNLNYDDLDQGDIIEYKLQDDGTIDVVAKVYDASSEKAVGEKNVKLIKLSEINKDNIEDENKDNYYTQGDSLYFDYSKYKENNDNDDDDLAVLKWNDFRDVDIPSPDSNNAVEALLVTDEKEDDEIKFLAFTKNYDKISDRKSYAGYLLNYETNDDIMTVKVDVFGEGVKEYKVMDYNDQDQIKELRIEELIVFVLRAGELKPMDSYYDGHKLYGDASGGKLWFKEKDGNSIVVYVGNKNTTKKYEYDSKVVIYNDDDEKNINSMDEGDAIEFIIKDGKILAIKYKEKENLPKDKQLDGSSSYKNKGFGVIIKTDKGMDDQVKLWTQTGETIKYDIDDYGNNLDLDDLDSGDIIEYNLQDDGAIDVISKIYDASSEKSVGEKNVKLLKLSEINKDNIEDENNDNYYNQNDSLYFDYSEYKENNHSDDDDLRVLKWSNFKDLDIPSHDSNNAIEVLLVTDEDEDDEIKLLVFIKNYDEISDADSYVGYLLKYDIEDDIMTVTVDIFCEGEKEYKVTDDDDQAQIKKHGIEELIVFVLRGGDLKLKDLNYDDNEFYGDASGGKIWFKEKDGNRIVVYVGDKNTTKKYYYDSKVVIYNDDDEKNINSLDEGDALEFIMKDGEISAIKYTEKEDLAKDKQLK